MTVGQQHMVSAALLGLAEREHALYRFFDATDVLLYVGISVDPILRMKAHRREKDWWLQVRSMTVEPFPSRQEALAAEAKAIRAEKPLHNVQHNELVPTQVAATAQGAAYASGMRDMAQRILDGIGEPDAMPDIRRRVTRWPSFFDHQNEIVNLASAAMEQATDRWIQAENALHYLLGETPLTDDELLMARGQAIADLERRSEGTWTTSDLLVRQAYYAACMLRKASWRAFDARRAAALAQTEPAEH